jgi:hypothetical protein
MGISAKDVLAQDPELLRRELYQREMQQLNPDNTAAGAIGGLLGRGLGNVTRGRGFFASNDNALQGVTRLQGYQQEAMQLGGGDTIKTLEALKSRLIQDRELAPFAFNVDNYLVDYKNKTRKEGGQISLSTSDLEKIAPEDRPRAIQAYQTTGKLPPDIKFIGAVDKPKEQRDAIDFIRKNPEQSTFVLQDLAKRIEANPQDAAAIKEYEQVARAASEGSIEKFEKANKEELGSEIDKLRLLDYKNRLNESATLTSAARYNNEIDAARDLLKVYEIDVTKPLEGQVKAKILYGPLASELTNAYERALRKKTNEGGRASAVPSAPAVSKKPDPALTTALQAANIPYEPEKYDYRVVNGTVQRKIKGK